MMRRAVLAIVLAIVTTAAAAQDAADERRAYATTFERALLSIGASVTVSVAERRSSHTSKVPAMTASGPFTKSVVFNLLRDGAVVEAMRRRGFRELKLVNELGDEVWVFDLGGPTAPRCNTTRLVCW